MINEMNMILLFFAGLILANGIPHFFNGISGRRFHSPFAKPSVKGLSSPLLNVIWGLINFIIAVVLIIWSNNLILGINPGFIVFSCGFAISSIGLSILFGNITKD